MKKQFIQNVGGITYLFSAEGEGEHVTVHGPLPTSFEFKPIGFLFSIVGRDAYGAAIKRLELKKWGCNGSGKRT